MSNEHDSRTTFTFRIACDEIKRVGAHLSALTSQVKAVGDSIDSTQVAIDKRRKELRALTKTIASKRKTLVKLRKRAGRELAYLSKSEVLNTSVQSAEYVNTAFATEDMSIAIMSPSPRKRKRFAGIWDDVDIDVPESHTDKRARVDVCANESKENFIPEREAGPSNIRAETV